jgi:hypothetical protein
MIPIVRAIQKIIGLVIVSVAACTVLSLPSWAGPSEYLNSLSTRSLTNGFQRSTLVVLTPDPAPGKQVVAQRLLSKLNGNLGSRLVATNFRVSQSDNRLVFYVGENSYLDVYADGTKFRFRGDIDNAKRMARTPTGKLSNTELESLGRAFITKNLSDFVKRGRNDSITFLGTRYLHDGGTDLNGTTTDEVIANIAIFGREVNGVPVVGSGSKIAVWFTNDRQPAAFDVDWPSYRGTGLTQRILSKEQLQTRIQAANIPLKGSSNAKLSRYECGYVDLGATKRGNVIQAGCSLSYVGHSGTENNTGESLTWARTEFVPAGSRVLGDSRWPLAQLIAKQGELKQPTTGSLILSPEKDPGNAPKK